MTVTSYKKEVAPLKTLPHASGGTTTIDKTNEEFYKELGEAVLDAIVHSQVEGALVRWRDQRYLVEAE